MGLLDPSSADPAEYGVVLAVEQSFANQLRRTVVIDSGFVLDAALGMQVAPYVRITIPGTDNCGYPDGIVVRSGDGDVEVVRPGPCGAVCGILVGILKAMAHTG